MVLADDCVIVDETERRINTELGMCSETRKLKASKISYVTLKLIAWNATSTDIKSDKFFSVIMDRL